ncbi:hypothetical protein BJV78DRAFT_1297250, partial [Lactifluus subvellereus]
MSSHSVTGPAAMPGPRSAKAPYFSGQPEDRIADFLLEYEGLATGYKLSEKEKVETILRYVPFSVRELWKTLTGYASADWNTFRTTLEELYPDTAAATRYTKHVLQDFIQLSSRYRMRDENDVLQYYRRFLTISNPLRTANQITADDCSADFFLGFHPDDRDVLSSRLFSMKPQHPSHKPYDLEDVFTAALSLLGIAASRTAELTLPLREVNVLVNNKAMVAGVLDSGSQIIAMRADLFCEAGTPPLNPNIRLEMEGANSTTSWTLGCAENLPMRIGNVDFLVHAHVVETAPFKLLLGRPFSKLLLSGLQDHADGRVDLTICDPSNPTRSVSVPT